MSNLTFSQVRPTDALNEIMINAHKSAFKLLKLLSHYQSIGREKAETAI
jgi:hypothetical protein